MITIKCQIGKNVIEVAEDTAKKAIEEIAFFQNLPAECPICQSAVKFTFRTPQNYTYYGLECTGPDHHAANFGQNKEGGGLFYKYAEPWTSYKDRNSTSQEPPWEN
jgi:hypothetical protein